MTTTLALPGEVHVGNDRDEVFFALGNALWQRAQDAIEQRGVFHLALSGGSSPEPFYQQLATDPHFRSFPWDRTHLWLVDERRVPEDDERSNIKMIREALVDHTTMPTRQVHPMPVMEDDPAALYENTLREALAPAEGETPRLDAILLGMGGDCHTASLFPHSEAIGVTDRWIAVNEGEAVTPPPRVTMTYPLINAGRYVAALVLGEKKFEALKRIEQQVEAAGPDARALPITGVQPTAGPLHWHLDAAAAGLTVG
jgi:6-phosphogluconolactonase